MNVWIQRHDFSSDETTLLSADEAAEIFRRFDWDTELQHEEQALAGGIDCCDAGMGLVSQDGSILHICPGRGGMAMIHYNYSRRRSLLGLVSWEGDALLTVEDFPVGRVLPLMEHHFGGRQDALLAMLSTEGKPLN